MKKLLVNPFEKYSEIQLLITGLLVFIAGSVGAYYFGARFDGALDLHFNAHVTYLQPFADNAIDTLSLLLCLYIAGCIINQKTRFIDILTAVLIARMPYYLLMLFNANGYIDDVTNSLMISGPQNVSPFALVFLLVFALVSVGMLVWFVALLYNGFKTAVNLKSTSHKLLFALAILLAELLSKLLIDFINY